MAFVHGKNTVVKIDNSGGTPVDLSQYTSKSSWPRSVETADVTTFGKTSKAKIAGLKDAKFSMEGPWEATVEAHMQGILGLETATCEFAPEGTTTGKRKITAEGILVSYEPDSSIDGAVGWKAEFEITGDVTVTVY